MFKVALKLAALPALMLAAMPAQSTELVPAGVEVESASTIFQTGDVVTIDWYLKKSLRFANGTSVLLPVFPSARPGGIPQAATLPEPMSWAMMIIGLTAIGASCRSIRGRRVSFS